MSKDKLALTCDVVGCEKPNDNGRRAYCGMHRARISRHGTVDLPIISKIKSCKSCGSEYTTNQRNNTSKYCQSCRKMEWRLYKKKRTWELSEAGKKYQKEYQRRYKYQLRDEVYSAYGKKCNCCGVSEIAFLSVDHVNNNGNEDRKKNIMGQSLYRKIIASGFSRDYQILCMNCNFAKKNEEDNICPHEKN